MKTAPQRRGEFNVFSLNPGQFVRWEFKGSNLGETRNRFGAMCAIWESLLWQCAEEPIAETLRMVLVSTVVKG